MSEPGQDLVSHPPVSVRRSNRLRWWLECFWQQTAHLIWILLALGLILRFTVRDYYMGPAVIYYMTPIPALPIWTLIAAVAWACSQNSKQVNRGTTPTTPLLDQIPQANFGGSDETIQSELLSGSSETVPAPQPQSGTLRTNRRTAFLTPLFQLHLIIALGFSVWAFTSQYVDRTLPSRSDDLRIVFWNTAHLPFALNHYIDAIRAWDSPLIALVEADQKGQFIVEKWTEVLPEYQILGTHFGGLVAFKGELKKHAQHQLSIGSWCDQFDLSIDNNEFTVLLVDISSQLTLSRKDPIQSLATMVESLNDRPVIIMGDFNTPDDSIWFDTLRKRNRQLFRECGKGYAPTWPVPVPVLTLDQVWVNPRVYPTSCQLGSTICSDHRPVISHLSFSEPKCVHD